MGKIERALLSVSDKTGLVELAKELHERGVELLSTGGTAEALASARIPVTRIADHTGSPEILGGRVKTLHPRIFGGILARAREDQLAELAEYEIPTIDLVVVNLYPFERAIAADPSAAEEAIEQIDIGGPSLLRAAAKNYERVAVVTDPADYGTLLEEISASDGEVGVALRRRLARRAFARTAAYDATISNYLEERLDNGEGALADVHSVQLHRVQELRYGENPHQQAAFYRPAGREGPLYEQVRGKALSYNNIVDIDAAWALTCALPDTGVCIVKHTNPCGAASVKGEEPAEAYRRAHACDPVSAFGGIVGCNRSVTAEMAAAMKEIFLEAVVAPAFDEEALAVLRRKKKLRLVSAPAPSSSIQWRSALGGILLQGTDSSAELVSEGEVVTEKRPNPEQLEDLQFAWIVCKHVKSNAIVFVKDQQLVGVGAGQMSRVDSVKLAVSRATLPLDGAAVASDAFFPFRDGLEQAVDAGAIAIVQPGGSIRDDEVTAAANERGVSMIFTGLRHFRH